MTDEHTDRSGTADSGRPAEDDGERGPAGGEAGTSGETRRGSGRGGGADHGHRRATSRTGVPAEGEVVPDRFSSDEVFQRIVAAADEELTSGGRELFFSGVAGGLAISVTFLLYASLTASAGSDSVLRVLLYPIGFIYIIIGGYQLYTENTLPPVALVLERLSSVPSLLRHWAIVLAGNFAGGVVGAVVLAWGGVFTDPAAVAAEDIALKGIEAEWWDLFFKGGFAGLIVAGVVWVEYAARDTISRLVIVYLAFLAIPLGNLFHVVVSFTELVYLGLLGEAAFLPGLTEFVLPVLLGNTLGGVVLVTVVNYYQTSEHRLGTLTGEKQVVRLSRGEWLLGHYVGRSYVPIIEEHTPSPATTDDAYRILVVLSNPRTEGTLVELATELASQHPGGTVHLAHMVQLPGGTSVGYGTRQRQRIRDSSVPQLDALRAEYGTDEVRFETSTVVSHRSFEEIFSQASQSQADLVVMGWGTDRHWDTLRAGRPIDELTNNLPCDFLVVNDRAFDPSRVLVPTAGGPDSALAAEVAGTLAAGMGAEVSLLHVVDSPAEREDGEQFLTRWADRHGLTDARRLVDDSGNVERAIVDAAGDHTLLVLGATERGVLRRLATDSLHLDVVNSVECSVLLAERPHRRSLLARLVGRGRRTDHDHDTSAGSDTG